MEIFGFLDCCACCILESEDDVGPPLGSTDTLTCLTVQALGSVRGISCCSVYQQCCGRQPDRCETARNTVYSHGACRISDPLRKDRS